MFQGSKQSTKWWGERSGVQGALQSIRGRQGVSRSSPIQEKGQECFRDFFSLQNRGGRGVSESSPVQEKGQECFRGLFSLQNGGAGGEAGAFQRACKFIKRRREEAQKCF